MQAELDWNVRSPQAFALKDEILHSFRFAFRNVESQLSIVSKIAEGYGNDDMIQDLNDLAVLGKENVDLLTAISFDIQKLDQAAELSAEMGNLLAIANGSRQGGNEAKILRDRAYTHLKELVDEIRACGKFVFWKDPKRLSGYASSYFRKQRSDSKQKASEPEEGKA